VAQEDNPKAKPSYAQNLAFLTLLIIILFERSTFYGMMSIIAVHLRNIHHPNPSSASGIISATVYGLAFIGGLFGDRVSYRLSALLGSILAFSAYLALFLNMSFWTWIPLLGLGIGLFKPVLPVMVGKSVEGIPDELPKRQLRYYTFVNIGGFCGPFVVGILYNKENPSLAFGFIAVCAFLTVLVQMLSYSKLAVVNYRNPIERQIGGRLNNLNIVETNPNETKLKVIKLLFFCLLSVCFWTGYHSFYGPVSLWFDSFVDRQIGNWLFPTAWIQNINPTIVVIVGLFMANLFGNWSLSKRIVYSLVLMSISFAILALLSYKYNANVPLLLSFITIFVASIAELLISPLGLTTVVSLAPPKYVAVFMSIWYLASASGGYLSGTLGNTPGPKEFLVITFVSILAALFTLYYRKLLDTKDN